MIRTKHTIKGAEADIELLVTDGEFEMIVLILKEAQYKIKLASKVEFAKENTK